MAKTTRNLPSNYEALPVISKVLEEFARGMNHATHPTVWKLNEQPLVIERFTKGIQSIILGKKTPQQVAQEVQAIKVREMARAAKRRK